MKEKIKKIIIKNWKLILIFLLFTLIICWFSIRPSIVYHQCNKIATDKAGELYKEKFPYMVEQIKKGYFVKDDYEAYYKQCLRRSGINQ